MDQSPYVERIFELDGGELPVRFDLPFKAPGGEFQCNFSIAWPEREQRSYICGEDGVQALMLAMRHVHSILIKSEAYKAGRLTWCEQSDLDLPPTWGAGPLYYVPSPPNGDESSRS